VRLDELSAALRQVTGETESLIRNLEAATRQRLQVRRAETEAAIAQMQATGEAETPEGKLKIEQMRVALAKEEAAAKGDVAQKTMAALDAELKALQERKAAQDQTVVEADRALRAAQQYHQQMVAIFEPGAPEIRDATKQIGNARGELRVAQQVAGETNAQSSRREADIRAQMAEASTEARVAGIESSTAGYRGAGAEREAGLTRGRAEMEARRAALEAEKRRLEQSGAGAATDLDREAIRERAEAATAEQRFAGVSGNRNTTIMQRERAQAEFTQQLREAQEAEAAARSHAATLAASLAGIAQQLQTLDSQIRNMR
jgi:colicin import membrane protein